MMGIFWVAIIVGIVFLVRYFKREDANRIAAAEPAVNETAAEILERRYVNGELSHEEFLVMKSDIRKQEKTE